MPAILIRRSGAAPPATTGVPSDPEIWSLASVLVRRFGSNAIAYADTRATKALHDRDLMSVQIWLWIRAAIEKLLKSTPDPGERIH